MIDFEEGRISVRLSEGTYYLLQRDIAKFCFVSNDGSYNENGFYNTVLPSLHENRLSERFALRKILEKRFANKVKPEFKEELFCEMDDVFNIVQFEDKGTKYHQAKIDIRLSKENMKKFSGVFSLLKTQEIPKSAYIRNLLNQYTAMRIDEREYLCYKREYEDLMQVVNEGLWLEYKTGQIVEDIFVMDVDLCCYDNEFYVVGIVFDEGEGCFFEDKT